MTLRWYIGTVFLEESLASFDDGDHTMSPPRTSVLEVTKTPLELDDRGSGIQNVSPVFPTTINITGRPQG